MTEHEAAKLLKILQGSRPRAEFSEDNVDVYTVALSDLPYDLARRAVMNLILTTKYLPSIAEIRRAAAELVDPLPGVDEAYEAARIAARDHSPYSGPNPAYEALHPMVRQALQTVGIETMAYTDQPMIAAAQFRQVYERLRDRELVRRQTERGRIAELEERRKIAASNGAPALTEGRSA